MRKDKIGKKTAILVMMLMISSVFNSLVVINVSSVKGEKTFTLISALANQDLSINNIRKEIQNPPQILGFDLIANEVYLSSQEGDWKKEHVVTNPQAGDNLYIHWNFTILGSGSVNPFYWKIQLRVQSGGDVINVERQVTDPDYLKAGYYYTYCFINPWKAPGGNYNLKETVDSRNNIPDEVNEGNNVASKDFSVVPTDKKFDMEANEIWLSSRPYDWNKSYLVTPPINPGKEIYFYFQWTIWGNPGTLVNPYYVNITLSGSDGFYFEDLLDEEQYRQAGYIIKVYLHDDANHGWIAVTGDHTLTCTVDSQNTVINEWNENNNALNNQFTVTEGDPDFYFLHLTDIHIYDLIAQDVWGKVLVQINEMNPLPAFVVVTGDLLDIGDPGNYYLIIDPFSGQTDKPKLEGSRITSSDGGWFITPYHIPIYFCPGNHDSYQQLWHPLNFETYEANIADSYYHRSFSVGSHSIEIFSLNSGKDPGWGDTTPQGDGLKNEYGNEVTKFPANVAASTADIKIVLTHHPYNMTNGDQEMTFKNERDMFNDTCYNNHVNLICSGHTHSDVVLKLTGEWLANYYQDYRFTPSTHDPVQLIGNNIWQSPTIPDDYPGAYRKIGVFPNGDIKIFGEAQFTALGEQSTCFLADTKVTMADGSVKNIQDIKIGDYVKSRYELINKVLPARVSKVYQHTADEMGEYYLIINKNLRVTPNHPLFTNGKWTAARDVKVGDYLLGIIGNLITISSIEKVYQKMPSYNFEVETPESIQIGHQQSGCQFLQAHTYFVNGVEVTGEKIIVDEYQSSAT